MLKNQTKNKILSKKVKICNSLFSKAKGLMFSKRKTLIFIFKTEKIVPLHMFFVFYPIDVLFLNKNKEVIEIKRDLRPFTFYSPKQKSKYIIELPAGMINSTGTSIGDTIRFK